MLNRIVVLLCVAAVVLACGAASAKAAWEDVRAAKITNTVTIGGAKTMSTTIFYKADKVRTEIGERSMVGSASEFEPERWFSGDYAIKRWKDEGAKVTVTSDAEGKLGEKTCTVVKADVTAIERRGRTIVGPQHLTLYLEPGTRLVMASERTLCDTKTGDVLSTEKRTIEYGVEMPDSLFAGK